MDWAINKLKAFTWLFAYKIFSLAIQTFLGSLIATNGSSEEPFIKLKTIAYFAAIVVTFRAIDALIDPAFRNLAPRELIDNGKTDTKV